MSFAEDVVLPGNAVQLRGQVSGAAMLIPLDKGEVAIGLVNPWHRVAPSPIQNLASKPFNAFTTLYSPPPLPNEVRKFSSGNPLTIGFTFRERFFFDESKSKKFYEEILPHIW